MAQRTSNSINKIKNKKKQKKVKEQSKIYFFSNEKFFSRNKLSLQLKIILFIIITLPFCDCIQKNEVTIKTKETGFYIKILNDAFFNQFMPSEIKINDSPIREISNKYRLKEESTIIITWDIDITSTSEMLYNCQYITEIDLSNFDSSQVIDMSSMFYWCNGLTILHLSNLDTSHVTNMGQMFSGCWELTTLDLSNFDTSKVENMNSIFMFCQKLISLDISSFNTQQVTDMGNMFNYCEKLSSLNLSNFDTSQVTNIGNMFSDCHDLVWLNISSFNTTQVKNMEGLFSYCSSLTSINLSHFDFSKVELIGFMFGGCSKITSLNLSNIDTSKVDTLKNMFFECSELIYLDISNFDTSNVKYIDSIFSGCSKLSSLDLSSFIFNNESITVHSMFCNSENLEYINFKNIDLASIIYDEDIFYNTSQNLVVCSEKDNDILIKFIGEKTIIGCNKNNELNEEYKCYMKNPESYNMHTCNICGDKFLKKYQSLNDNLYINCFESKDYYYLDETYWEFKECHYTCQTCEIGGDDDNNNCLKCKDEFKYELNIPNTIYKNCYENEPNVIDNHIISDSDEKQNLNTYKLNTADVEYQIEKSSEIITNNLIIDFDINELKNSKNKKIIYKNIMIVLTSTYEQKNNEEENNITLDIGKCENILKDNYNISENESLYILQMIYEEEGMKIPKLEYEIYYDL